MAVSKTEKVSGNIKNGDLQFTLKNTGVVSSVAQERATLGCFSKFASRNWKTETISDVWMEFSEVGLYLSNRQKPLLFGVRSGGKFT